MAAMASLRRRHHEAGLSPQGNGELKPGGEGERRQTRFAGGGSTGKRWPDPAQTAGNVSLNGVGGAGTIIPTDFYRRDTLLLFINLAPGVAIFNRTKVLGRVAGSEARRWARGS